MYNCAICHTVSMHTQCTACDCVILNYCECGTVSIGNECGVCSVNERKDSGVEIIEFILPYSCSICHTVSINTKCTGCQSLVLNSCSCGTVYLGDKCYSCQKEGLDLMTWSCVICHTVNDGYSCNGCAGPVLFNCLNCSSVSYGDNCQVCQIESVGHFVASLWNCTECYTVNNENFDCHGCSNQKFTLKSCDRCHTIHLGGFCSSCSSITECIVPWSCSSCNTVNIWNICRGCSKFKNDFNSWHCPICATNNIGLKCRGCNSPNQILSCWSCNKCNTANTTLKCVGCSADKYELFDCKVCCTISVGKACYNCKSSLSLYSCHKCMTMSTNLHCVGCQSYVVQSCFICHSSFIDKCFSCNSSISPKDVWYYFEFLHIVSNVNFIQIKEVRQFFKRGFLDLKANIQSVHAISCLHLAMLYSNTDVSINWIHLKYSYDPNDLTEIIDICNSAMIKWHVLVKKLTTASCLEYESFWNASVFEQPWTTEQYSLYSYFKSKKEYMRLSMLFTNKLQFASVLDMTPRMIKSDSLLSDPFTSLPFEGTQMQSNLELMQFIAKHPVLNNPHSLILAVQEYVEFLHFANMAQHDKLTVPATLIWHIHMSSYSSYHIDIIGNFSYASPLLDYNFTDFVDISCFCKSTFNDSSMASFIDDNTHFQEELAFKFTHDIFAQVAAYKLFSNEMFASKISPQLFQGYTQLLQCNNNKAMILESVDPCIQFIIKTHALYKCHFQSVYAVHANSVSITRTNAPAIQINGQHDLYLSFLRCNQQIYKYLQNKSKLFVNDAVSRYVKYLSFHNEHLPPLDVVVVWYFHYINTVHYACDLKRLFDKFINFPFLDICHFINQFEFTDLNWMKYVDKTSVIDYEKKMGDEFIPRHKIKIEKCLNCHSCHVGGNQCRYCGYKKSRTTGGILQLLLDDKNNKFAKFGTIYDQRQGTVKQNSTVPITNKQIDSNLIESLKKNNVPDNIFKMYGDTETELTMDIGDYIQNWLEMMPSALLSKQDMEKKHMEVIQRGVYKDDYGQYLIGIDCYNMDEYLYDCYKRLDFEEYVEKCLQNTGCVPIVYLRPVGLPRQVQKTLKWIANKFY